MPKQKGPLYITGTYNGMCFYEMSGEYYVRRKSSLSRRRVKGSPAFKRTMKNAGLLAQASKIAAEAYRVVPKKSRKREIFHSMTGKAMAMLRKGMDAAAITLQLQAPYSTITVAPQPRKQKTPAAPPKLPRVARHQQQRVPTGRYLVSVDGALKLNTRSLVRSSSSFFRDTCARSMKRGKRAKAPVRVALRAPVPV